jgi:hypothetical protein
MYKKMSSQLLSRMTALYSNKDGLTMLNKKADTLWEISNRDLSISGGFDLFHWKIFPTPNNRLVCSFTASRNGQEMSYLVSLRETE